MFTIATLSAGCLLTWCHNVIEGAPADQGLHFERILPLQLCFCAIGNKIAGNAQQHDIQA